MHALLFGGGALIWVCVVILFWGFVFAVREGVLLAPTCFLTPPFNPGKLVQSRGRGTGVQGHGEIERFVLGVSWEPTAE